MRTNYKTYVFSKKEWIFCLLQSIGITGVVNLFCYRSWWAWGLVIPVGHLVYQMEAERDGRAKTANSAKSF